MASGARRADATAALARYGFADVDAAQRHLGPDGPVRLWDAGPVDPDAALVVEALGAAADPDLAVAGLSRLHGADPRAEVLRSALRSDAGLRARLTSVLGASHALGEHLVRHSSDWVCLAGNEPRLARPSAYGLRARLLIAVGAEPDHQVPIAGAADASTYDVLRACYRTQVLHLAARDLADDLAVDDVAAELADLAAAALEAALAIARAGEPGGATATFAVIGMGKCGGRELNYASDVDVIFVAEPDASRAISALAAGVIRACSDVTAEGALWPVDAALRPEGRDGPLVRTVASYRAYYERWAKTWEFQAWLKARPVAGDHALGSELLGQLAPLVWDARKRPNFVDETRAMKQRVEDAVPAAEASRQLKLSPGGLRDVEFAVQLLQLVHGRADDSLRSGHTMTALDSLARGGYVGEADAAALADAYRFLRRAEHRLQLQRLRRTHTLPTDPAGRRWLARAMGFRDGAVSAQDGFAAEHERHAAVVRRLHEQLFYRPLLGTVSRLPADALRLTPDAARDRLDALGFADAAGALRHLEALTTGLSRRSLVLRTMLPVMLPWFADAHDPDAGLLAFRTVAEALGDTPWFVALLRDSDVVAERLARLLAASRYVADLLARAPDAVALVARDDDLAPRPLDTLQSEYRAVVARHDDAEQAVASVRALRRRELLRIACADLLGLLDTPAVGRALTDAAQATLDAALAAAARAVAAHRGGSLDVTLTVVGLGRLGGGEQGYGSDADVMYVHDPLPGVPDDVAAHTAKLVAEEMRRLLAQPAPDPPLEVDAGLRPEGRQGPLSLSLAGYARYYEQRVAVWERQALLRARVVAGDADLGARFTALIAGVRWPQQFGDVEVREVRRIKARVEAERLPKGADRTEHTKLGHGGLADIEWTAQLLQLRYAHAYPQLRTTSTLDALAAAADCELLDREDAATLRHAWINATRARNALMLVRGRASDALPTDARTLAGIARAVGYPAGGRGEFLEAYRRATRRARAVVERVFYA